MKFLKSKRERVLFVFFIGAMAAVALCICGGLLLSRQAFLQSELFPLQSESLELRSWIGDRKLILSRQHWLDEHLQRSSDVRKNGLEFLESIEKQAQSAGAQITNKSILDPEVTSDWTGIPVRVSIQGEFRSVVLLLHELQQPGKFVILREISIKASGDTREVVSDLEFLKVFKPTSL